jgi:hypothetical protein
MKKYILILSTILFIGCNKEDAEHSCCSVIQEIEDAGSNVGSPQGEEGNGGYSLSKITIREYCSGEVETFTVENPHNYEVNDMYCD